MQRQIEDELETLLLRLDPNLPKEWKGAAAADIVAIEKIAGRSLPQFYRWFLERMGEDMGSLSYSLLDFSVGRILSVYEDGDITPDGRHLLIGYNLDEAMPMHVFYDLKRSTREDCMVGQMEINDNHVEIKFETFREMLGWRAFSDRRIRQLPQRCWGHLAVAQDLARPRLDAVMKDLGFETLLPSGPFFALYDRPDAALSCMAQPTLSGRVLAFSLGGLDVGSLRHFLGQLATSNLEVKVREWEPAAG